MKAKRKLWLSIASLALVIVMTGAVVGVTLAALMGSVGSSFTITYTAKNVEATVIAMWANGKEYEENNMEAAHQVGFNNFSADEESNITTPIDFGTLEIKEPDDYIILGFMIQNNGENGFGVDIKVEGIDENSNVITEKITTGLSVDFEGWEEIYVTPTGTENPVVLVAMFVYVEDPTKEINLTGSFELTLDSNAEVPPMSGRELFELISDGNPDSVKNITFDWYEDYEGVVGDVEGIELRGMNGAKLYRVPNEDKFDVYILSENEIYASAHQEAAFQGNYLETITFNNYNTSNVVNMRGMFDNCIGLKSVDLTGWDVRNVTTMRDMFTNCQSLTEVKMSDWNTLNVINMDDVFYGCTKLKSLDLSGWNTSKVTTMLGMFGSCRVLTDIKFGENWDTSKVTNMHGMFGYCKELTELDLSGWNTSNVIGGNDYYTGMAEMFFNCEKLQKIYVSQLWDVKNLVESSYMFTGCTSLEGAVAYSASNANDKTFANYTTGYLTYKAHP